MKNTFGFLISAAFILTTACSKSIIDPDFVTAYYYKNDCSVTLIISSCSPIYNSTQEIWQDGRDSIFTIAPGEEAVVKYKSAGFVPPLLWGLGYNRDRDSTIVSNGVSQLIHYYKNNDNLYVIGNYDLFITEGDYGGYRYTFTDEDFE